MGRRSLEGMIEMAPQRSVLEWHLRYNHYPPVSLVFVPIAEKAIKIGRKAIEDDDMEEMRKEIKMPNGEVATVEQIIEGLHLESFLPQEEV